MRASGEWTESPADAYRQIKERLLRFTETVTEKQMRVLKEWDDLFKDKKSALAFEPLWERAVAELENSGLARNPRELMLNYLSKVGPTLAREIQKDSRSWPDGDGGLIHRRVATWEECHQVAIELESMNANSRVLNGNFNTQAGGRGKGADRAHVNTQDGHGGGKGGGRGVCYEWRDKGKCSKEGCPYDHDKAQKGNGKGGKGGGDGDGAAAEVPDHH